MTKVRLALAFAYVTFLITAAHSHVVGTGDALSLVQRQHAPLHRRGVWSFATADALLCAEGKPRTVEAALALKSASPRGALFVNTWAKRKSCDAGGYQFAGGEDPCYPGLEMFFKTKEGRAAFAEKESAALGAFAENYSLSKDTASLMADCVCHPESKVMDSTGSQCASLEATTGAWVHQDPANGQELLCDEGPFQHATYALATLKSSAQLPMHLHDQISPRNCSSLGFPEVFPPFEHCFPKMHIWTRTQIDSDWGVSESQRVEKSLFQEGGFKQWALARGQIVGVLQAVPGCQCLPESEVGHIMGRICRLPMNRPPVRDWFVS